MRYTVVVADAIDPRGLAPLETRTHLVFRNGRGPEALPELLRTADALLVRSETQVSADLLAGAERLKVVGRAGAGVDNIDVDAATRRGIVVVNAPGGNTFAAAEHTMALLLSAARHVAPADASLKRGEWRRSDFVGIEMRGKLLGLVGLGRVAAEVARRAQAFDLKVLAYDPYVSDDLARRLGVELVELPDLLQRSDFVSLHTPLSDQTSGLIGREQLALMKPTTILVNCARGGLIDEDALRSSLDDGGLAGAALDVFASEPATNSSLAQHPRVVATPHLGASTREAQASVARQVAEQVLMVLDGKPAHFAVNGPAVPPEAAELLQPYVELAQLLGCLVTQLAEGQPRTVQVAVRGEVAGYDNGLLATAVLKGQLTPISGDPVTFVNARMLARGRGLEVVEERSDDAEPYTNLISVTLRTNRGTRCVQGTIVHGEPHVVGIDDYPIDLPPVAGYLLVTRHRDQPGMIGRVGTLLGEADVNISHMQVGRQAPRGEAIMILAVDEAVGADVLTRLRAVPNMSDVRVIRL